MAVIIEHLLVKTIYQVLLLSSSLVAKQTHGSNLIHNPEYADGSKSSLFEKAINEK